MLSVLCSARLCTLPCVVFGFSVSARCVVLCWVKTLVRAVLCRVRCFVVSCLIIYAFVFFFCQVSCSIVTLACAVVRNF